MHPDSWKGMGCLRIDYTQTQGAKVRIWIVPAWGPSVARIEVTDEAGGSSYLEYVESDCKQFGAAGIWFPQTCFWEQRMDGKSLQKEEADVKVQSLNEPLSPTLFKLGSMDIPVGWPISGYRKEGLSYWDGKEIVAKDPPASPLASFGRESPANNWPYVIGAVAFALLAAGTIWFYFAQKKPASGPKKV